MKSRFVRTLVGSIIFLLLIALAFAVTQPVYRKIGNVLNDYITQGEKIIEDSTGFEISYRQLSPSIITGINIRNITAKEKRTGREVVSVGRISVKYNLIKLIFGDLEDCLNGLELNGVKVNITQSQIDRLSGGTQTGSGDSEQAFDINEFAKTFKQVVFSLPFQVSLKDISLTYSNSDLSATTGIKKVELQKTEDGRTLSGAFKGYVVAKLASSSATVGFQYSADGRILRDITGSSAMVTVSSYPKVDYSLGRSSYLLRYGNRKFDLRSLVGSRLFELLATLDLNTGDVKADLQMNSFDPFQILVVRNPVKEIEQFRGIKLTAGVEFSYGLSSSKLFWNTDGELTFPQSIAPDGEKVAFRINGDNYYIKVPELNATGSLVDLDFNGTYRMATMQPSGILDLNRFTLSNGNSISGQLYLEPLDKGFMCFIPQLFLNDASFTAIELDVVPKNNAVDLSFSMDDYSHEDFEEPGQIKVDASISTGKKSDLQASLSVKNLFLDSIAKTAAFFLNPEDAENVMTNVVPQLEPFVFTNEIYVSTDFKSVTYNSPYSLIANTSQKKQFLLLSFDGNETQLSVSQLDLIFDDQTVKARLDADIDLESQMIMFNADLNYNTLPYHFNGDLKNYKWLNISGDYNTQCAFNFENGVNGSLVFNQLPVKFGDYVFAFTTDLVIENTQQNGLNIDINKFEAEEPSGRFFIQPKLAFSGKVLQDSAVLNSIIYSDSLGMMEGSGEAQWNFLNDVIDNVTASITVENPLTDEKIDISGVMNNIGRDKAERNDLNRNLQFNLNADISAFPVARFVSGQAKDDTLSAVVTASGNFENPVLKADVKGFSMQLNGAPLVARGTAVLQSNVVSVPDLSCEWSGIKLKETSGDFNLSDFNGKLSSKLDLSFAGRNMFAPFELDFKNLSEKGKLDKFQLDFDSSSITGNLLNQKLPVHVSAVHVPGRTDITSGKNLGVTGWILDDGQMNFEVQEDKPVHFKFFGNMADSLINFNITDISADMSRLSQLVNTPFFSVYKGLLYGNLVITGLGTDPDMSGSFTLDEFEFNLPDYIPDHMSTKQLVLNFSQDEISVPQTNFAIKDTGFDVSAHMTMDRWALDSVDVDFVSGKNKGIPVDIKIPFARFKGEIGIDLKMELQDNNLNLDGSVELEKSEITLITRSGTSMDLSTFTSSSDSNTASSNYNTANPIDLNLNLHLLIGQKVHIGINPFLRGLVAPDTPIDFTMNSSEDTWNLKGDVVLRGGEVSWLNSTFYIKEGRVTLNETQNSFDPSITLRAETRERDDDGDPVTITLSAIRQNASTFSPVISSNPAKSENEILELLGQIVTGNSSDIGGVLLSSTDWMVQSTFMRRLENTLRDFFNFDIFSVRTMVLQNALKQSLNQGQSTVSSNSLGNYLDNSTVYIGKYFGSELYADALLQWSYDSSKDNGSSMVSGLVFQPELGFELAAPFANIRWNFAPDLGALQSSWVPATSITLSWKINF